MSALLLPLERVRPRDPALLARRARELAAPVESGGAEAALLLVGFRLGGMACAVEAAAVERAVARLERVVPLPTGAGERAAVFVDEEPVALADLTAVVGGTARPAGALAGSPGLVVRTPAGLLAVAVDGPLDLLEDRVAARAEPGPAGGARPEVTAHLASGASLLSSAWLVAWAERELRAQ
jgi:hypothetical protein